MIAAESKESRVHGGVPPGIGLSALKMANLCDRVEKLMRFRDNLRPVILTKGKGNNQC